ncbi:MAG: hypothetical protein JO290_12870 [Sphingomonadaceae bacterium]|nr:hypothetical protein [Sphingomonadaceae bacterium]
MAVYVTPSSTLASLIASNGNVVDSTGVAGTVDTLYQPNCVRVIGGGTGEFAQTMPFIGGATPTTIYFHFDLYMLGYAGGTNSILATFINSAALPVIRIVATNPNNIGISYWNGTSWVTSGTLFILPINSLVRMDVSIVCGVSGSVTIRLGGAVVAIVSGLSAAVNNIAGMQLMNPSNSPGYYMYYSQVAAADFDLRDYRGQAATFNALGSYYTGGSGLITDVTDSSDTTFWSLTAAGGRGATTSALSAIGGLSIYGAYLNGRVRLTGGMSNAQFGFRDATPTDNTSANINPNGGFEPRGALITSFSGGPVTYAGFNAAEKFVKAA